MRHANGRVRAWAVIGATATLSLGACAAKWHFKAEGKFIGVEGTIEFGYNGAAIKAEELPDDKRVDMEFLDEQGNPIPPGAQGVGEGDQVAPPSTAVSVVVSGPSGSQDGCVGCTSSPQAPAPDSAVALPYYQDRWIHVETIVPDLLGTNALGNVVFHASVRVPLQFDALDVYELVKPVLIGGAGTPVPNDPNGIAVDVKLFQRITVVPVALGSGLPGGGGGMLAGAHLFREGGLEIETMDVTSAFTSFDLWVDGHHVGDDGILATPDHESWPNGWRLVRVSVPEALLDYSTTQADIDLELRVLTPEDSLPHVVTRSLEAWK